MTRHKKQRPILVTGCAGFIGSNFISEFKIRFKKTTIIGIDDFSTGRLENLDKGIVFYKGSISDEKFIEKIFATHQPEYVFHFAANPRVTYSVEFPTKTTESNLLGTISLLEKSRDYKIKRFIYSSSCAVYGKILRYPTRESDIPNPISPYGLQKLVGEHFCRMFSDLYALDTVSLRYFNVFGPGQYGGHAYAGVICNWLESLYFYKNKPFMEGDGKQSRDFCFVKDVVRANMQVMKFKGKFMGESFNIGSGININLLEVKKLIEIYTKKDLRLTRTQSRVGDIYQIYADISKANKWFNYKPKIDFQTSLQETIRWFKERKKLTRLSV